MFYRDGILEKCSLLDEVDLYHGTTEDLLLTAAEHAGTGAFSTFKINGYPANFLNAGQCIFAVDSTAGATWMGSDAPLVHIAEEKLVQFETQVMTIPQLDPQNPTMISQGPSMCVFRKEDPQQVLAAWLFTQFMLTNDVQIAYSQTEGYCPVTTKAQQTETYQDYLSRGGEDNDFYYSIKLDATRLLLDNTPNTFVTPVFNGSAALRNAAGQMVENVVRAAKRGEAVNGATIRAVYRDVFSLYRLDQLDEVTEEDVQGPLPKESVILLGGLGLCWAGMGLYILTGKIRKKRK